MQQAQPAQVAVQQLPAFLQVLCAIQFVEPCPHLVVRSAAGQETGAGLQPVTARRRFLAGENLDPLPGLEHLRQRHDPAIHLRATSAVADHAVNGIGEVEHGAALRQVDHLALGRQCVHTVFHQIAVEPLQRRSLAFASGFRRLFQQLAHPRNALVHRRTASTAAFLVAPVRGHAQFGLRVHLASADLHLHGFTLRPDHRGMQ